MNFTAQTHVPYDLRLVAPRALSPSAQSYTGCAYQRVCVSMHGAGSGTDNSKEAVPRTPQDTIPSPMNTNATEDTNPDISIKFIIAAY